MSENTSKMSMARLSLRRISSRLTFLEATIESSHSFFKRACSFLVAAADFLSPFAPFADFFDLADCSDADCSVWSDCSSCAVVCSAWVLLISCSLIVCFFSFICFLHYLTCVWCATSCTFPYVILSLAKDLADRRISLRRMFRLHFVSLNMTDEKHFGACV